MVDKLIARITDPRGENPITLERADDIQVFEAVNSSDEGGSFTLPANDPKIAHIDYTKWWEIWDAKDNRRRNYGPIHEISESNEQWKISGPGRSQLLEDLIMTKHTFYYPVNRFLDDLRYENVAAEPRTTVYVYGYHNQPPTSDPKYYGLSKKTGPNVIDDVATFSISDKRLPTFHTTDSYWSGTDKADGITINLGQTVPISRASLLFPWWGGYKRFTNRAYDFTLQHSNDLLGSFETVTGKSDNKLVTGDRYGGHFFYFRPALDPLDDPEDKYGFEPLAERVSDTPIEAQYWRVDISATHAWYSQGIGANALVDDWEDQCTPPPVGSGSLPGSISSKELFPENDCHASIVEIGLYEEIIGRDEISNLVYQQVDSSSNQITYFHSVGGEETGKQKTVGTLDGYTLTKYEPGLFMKRIRFSWAGAGAPFTKFFPSDPDGSMTSSAVAVVDQNNSLVYRTLLTSGTKDLLLPAYTQFVQIKGATGVQIINTDAWLGAADAFSVDNSIAESITANDTATLHFRGISLKLYVTTPTGKQGGSVRLDLDGVTIADSVEIPDGVNNYLLYEITPDSGILAEGTTHNFKVTNLGGYVGIDAFAGYWEGSWIEFNEDHERVLYNDNAGAWTQIYDGRFSGGTMTKTNTFGSHMQFAFTGDRVQLFMAKGPNFGKATIYISEMGPYSTIIDIPGAGPRIDVDLGEDSGSPINHYIPRYMAFDSFDYWGEEGMPWATYNIHVRLLEVEEYDTKVNQATDALFDQDCIDCRNEKAATINKPIYIDGVSAHCTSGVSAKFNNETHLSILKSLSEVIQHEWRITEEGLYVRPRIGEDTDFIIREGSQAVITHDITNDVSQVATLLYSTGAPIDGVPLFTITEDKTNKNIMDRTIARTHDMSSVADYFTLIGASRTELRKRRTPEERTTINYVGELPIDLGDSFTLVTKRRPDGSRVRLTKITKQQSFSSGISYLLECVKWPEIRA
jgi:hypothetical protein